MQISVVRAARHCYKMQTVRRAGPGIDVQIALIQTQDAHFNNFSNV